MATPRTPKTAAGGSDPAIPDAELVADPGVDALPDPEVAPDMSEPLMLDDDTPPAPTPEPDPEADTGPSASPDPVWTEPPRYEPEPEPEPARQTGVLPLVIGGVIAALIGFGVSQVMPAGWPLRAETGLDAAVRVQATEIARLSRALAALPATDLTPVEAQLATLSDRITTAEISVAAMPVPEAAIDPGPRIADLERRIAKLEALPPGTVIEGGAGPDPAAMAALSQDIATLKSDIAAQAGSSAAAVAEVNAAAGAARTALAEAQAQAATLTAQASATAAAADARAALGRIEAAVETGAPFATAVEALRATGADIPEPLASAATAGLPTLASLQTSFPDAARLALDESLRAGMGAGTLDRFSAFLRTQTGARSLTPRQGGDPDAILSRAEAALKAADLPTALTEIAALPQAGQAALATWTAAAQARVAAMAALTTLATALER